MPGHLVSWKNLNFMFVFNFQSIRLIDYGSLINAWNVFEKYFPHGSNMSSKYKYFILIVFKYKWQILRFWIKTRNWPQYYSLNVSYVFVLVCPNYKWMKQHVDGLVQERSNSIANTLELHLSCTNPSLLPLKFDEIFHWNGNVIILVQFSSLTALQVTKKIFSSAAMMAIPSIWNYVSMHSWTCKTVSLYWNDLFILVSKNNIWCLFFHLLTSLPLQTILIHRLGLQGIKTSVKLASCYKLFCGMTFCFFVTGTV